MSPSGGGRGKGGRRDPTKHSHPGGSAAIVGVRLLRFSGVQGTSLLVTNMLHYGSIILVGATLGTAHLGGYSLLLFLTGLVTQLIHILTKPGTIRRTFGTGGDDEDDIDDADDDDDDISDLSDRPPWTLGVGIVFCIGLASIAIAAGTIFQNPIAQGLLGDASLGRLVMWASMTAGMLSIFRLIELVLWFERRPKAFLLIDTSRPALNLIFMTVFILSGMGLEGSILGATVGTAVSTTACLLLLWRTKSFEWGFSLKETWEILKRSKNRAPIVSGMWLMQNADTFILSRYVDHSQLGVYNLASRTGFVVSILPQGFRVAMRPLKKSAAFRAMKREYGIPTAQGQLLAYFFLLCFTSILLMFMLGEILVHDATGKFAHAGGLIPLSAASMTMAPLFRTISGMALYPYKRWTFVGGIIFATLAYCGLSLLLVPKLGIYGPPVGMLIAFAAPAAYMFLRSQLGKDPLDFPYFAVARGFVLAVALGAFFELIHPAGRWPQLGEVIGLMIVWVISLFVLKVVPEHHHAPIKHMAVSVVRGSALRFRARAGLRSLKPEAREALRKAVVERLPVEAMTSENGSKSPYDGGDLVRSLRRAGRNGEVSVGPRTEFDERIALYLFSDEPQASRQARMRVLLAEGADTSDLRTLEDLVEVLAKTPPEVWEGERPRVRAHALRSRFRRIRRLRPALTRH